MPKDVIQSQSAGPKILVVGDVMLDIYTTGSADRVSPESPVLVVKTQSLEVRLGGAANVAANCAALGATVSILGLVGADSQGATVKRLMQEQAIQDRLVVDAGRPTTSKERILSYAANRTLQQVLRLDRELNIPAFDEAEEALAQTLEHALADAQVVLVSDYGKGVCTARLLAELISKSQTRGIPVLVDPAAGSDWEQYRGASLIKPNRREAEAVSGSRVLCVADAAAVAQKAAATYAISQVVITLDHEGMLLYQEPGLVQALPSVPRQVADVTGAGDTVLAVLGVAMALGSSVKEAAHLANLAGGIQVERLGATSVTWEDIQRAEIKPRSAAKLVTRSRLVRDCEQLRAAGKKIVLTNGCFDLLHIGHVSYLEEAAEMGDVLVVALNSDASVRRIKGAGRPINNELRRAGMIAALSCVTYAVIFDEDTPIPLLEAVRPDVLVKGGDYRPDQVVGAESVRSYGGRVVVASKVAGVSTTGLLACVTDGS
jgi:D-beta-D-heptose 7-phosphate kinase/D-beta-D-heptose 1-phosphate adenosyltransferase